MIGRTLAHYEVTGLLGKGGMGEVYRARDTKLGREVALKVLSGDVADDPQLLERFEREAKTVAGLSHPHIVTLFSAEEDDGVHFLTMELVEGCGLDELLTDGSLSLEQVFEIGIAVADALVAAHEKGIVHRDLKPANVMLTSDSRIKVLDFGLARPGQEGVLTEDEVTQALGITQDGSILGTIPYMSPEQLRGREVGVQSDHFSFGILLFELATGRRPFHGESSMDVTSSILRDPPTSLPELRPDLPPRLGDIVLRCLEKEPEHRYPSSNDIARDLRQLQQDVDSGIRESRVHDAEALPPQTKDAFADPPTEQKRGNGIWTGLAALALVVVVLVVFLGRQDDSTPEVPNGEDPSEIAAATSELDSRSIAVLAFADMSPAKDQEYFSDGIAEELLNLLAKIPELRVISRSSAFSYKGKDTPLRQIASELNTAHILEGSVRKSGSQVRITAQLIEADTDTHVWSKTYDRTLDDIFAIQDEIAADVVSELEVTLLSGVPRTHAAHPEAYDLYLRAGPLVQWGMGPSEQDLREGIELLERATEIDPKFAIAHARLSQTYSALFYRTGRRENDEKIEKARTAAETAYGLDPNLVEAYVAKGLFHSRTYRDYDAALLELDRGRQLAPRNAEVLSWTGTMKKRQGQFAEASSLLERALDLDPKNPTILGELAVVHHCLGNYETAVAYNDRGIEADDTLASRAYRAGVLATWHGDLEPTRLLLEQAQPGIQTELNWARFLEKKREYEDALSHLAAAREADPDDYLLTLIAIASARIHWCLQNRTEAVRFAEEALSGLGESTVWPASMRRSLASAIAGRSEDSYRQLAASLEQPEVTRDALIRGHSLITAAEIHVINGEPEKAVATLDERLLLEQQFSVHDLMFNPVFDSLHDRPDFRALLERSK